MQRETYTRHGTYQVADAQLREHVKTNSSSGQASVIKVTEFWELFRWDFETISTKQVEEARANISQVEEFAQSSRAILDIVEQQLLPMDQKTHRKFREPHCRSGWLRNTNVDTGIKFFSEGMADITAFGLTIGDNTDSEYRQPTHTISVTQYTFQVSENTKRPSSKGTAANSNDYHYFLDFCDHLTELSEPLLTTLQSRFRYLIREAIKIDDAKQPISAFDNTSTNIWVEDLGARYKGGDRCWKVSIQLNERDCAAEEDWTMLDTNL